MSMNAESRATPWRRHRQARDARIEAGSRLARGKVVDNQKQADLLSGRKS
jgi:hypothetical protein